MKQVSLVLADEAATMRWGQHIARALQDAAIDSLVIYLQGELGAGKSCLSRAILQALGVRGAVKSPTYTLVEPYTLDSGQQLYHFDFYRLADPEEVYFLGVDDYFAQAYLSLVEWPERALGGIPAADLVLHLQYLEAQRAFQAVAHSPKGARLLEASGGWV